MEVIEIRSPSVTADPMACFHGNEAEEKKYDQQMAAAEAFYFDLLSKIRGMQYDTPGIRKDWKAVSVFGPDPEEAGAWRISRFDKIGAVGHMTRRAEEMKDLVAEFPLDGRVLQIIPA